ncbi:MAG: TolC family protein [Opitutaceae bacterium]|nr:TolC family protein [Opitutaceae bacterium]
MNALFRFRPVLSLIFAGVSFGTLAPSVARAAPLSLSEALARVEAGHPWMRTRDAQARLAEARSAQAAVRPTPEASLQFENGLGTGELRAFRSLETTLQLSRAIDWSARRSARAAVATGLNEAERLEWEEKRRELLAEAARRFIRIAAAAADVAASREVAKLAAETEADIRRRAEQTAATAADVARTQLTRVQADLEAEHAEHQMSAAKQALALLWGADTADFEGVQADLGTLPKLAEFGVLTQRLAATPGQARYAALGRWRLAQEKLARANAARGEARVGGGIRRVERTDDWGFVLGLNYAWPSRAHGEALAAEARAERDRTSAEGEAALIEAKALLFELVQEIKHAQIEHEAAQKELIPAAEAWLKAVRDGANTGRYAVRDLLEAQQALLGARQQLIRADAEYHRTLVEIERLIGASAAP